MTHLTKISVRLISILAILGFLWFFYASNQEPTPPVVDHKLNETIATCDGITERAAAHLVAVVEFQRLEIAGRKARVFKMCMNDHGYIENENWLKYSEPVAKKTSKDTGISVNEALENARRADMVQTIREGHRPVYWVKKETGKP